MTMKSRLSALDSNNITEAQKSVLDDILAGPRGNLDGPFLAWIHSPELAQHAQKLGAFCRYHTKLPLRLSELAILTTAAWWQSQAEWMIHEPIAREAGLAGEIIDALQCGQSPQFNDPEEEMIYLVSQSLYQNKRVPTELYNQAISLFGEQAVVELIGILGYYAFVAMTLNSFEMRPEQEQPLPFKQP